MRRARRGHEVGAARARLRDREILSGNAHETGAGKGRGIGLHTVAHAAAVGLARWREDGNPRSRIRHVPGTTNQGRHRHHIHLHVGPVSCAVGAQREITTSPRLTNREVQSRDAHDAGARDGRGIGQHAVARRAAVRVVDRRKNFNPHVGADRAPNATNQGGDVHRVRLQSRAVRRAVRDKCVGAGRAGLGDGEVVPGDAHHAGAEQRGGIGRNAVAQAAVVRARQVRKDADPRSGVDDLPDAIGVRENGDQTRFRTRAVRPFRRRNVVGADRRLLRDDERLVRHKNIADAIHEEGIHRHRV